jgi:CRP-like cAMP-binding protein
MSSAPLPSALNPRTQAFPILTAAQISRLRSAGELRQSKKDEILFDVGDTNVPFFVLNSGSMEIVLSDLKGEGPEATHGPGEFTGEDDHDLRAALPCARPRHRARSLCDLML